MNVTLFINEDNLEIFPLLKYLLFKVRIFWEVISLREKLSSFILTGFENEKLFWRCSSIFAFSFARAF